MMDAYVLYIDHNGHPAPLTDCYHATGSSEVSSGSHHYPSSTKTEVDSAFCPQCLSFHDASSASKLVYCPSPTCRSCPVCHSRCSVIEQNSRLFYQCLDCGYSTQNYLSVHRESDDVSSSNLVATLGSLYDNIVDSSSLKKEFLATAKFIEQNFGKLPLSAKREKTKDEGKDLLSLESERLILDSKELCGARFGENLKGISTGMIQYQESCTASASIENLFPLRIPLRLRKSRRCRKELARGRPGILVKPKLSPLEGDTSMRTGHGQWWKKDSSAMNSVPHVEVLSAKTCLKGDLRSFLLRITNPDLNDVAVRLASSIPSDDKTTKSVRIHTVDTQKNIKKRISFAEPSGDKWELVSETSLLSSWDDSVVTIGSKALSIPDTVESWAASEIATVPGFVTLGTRQSTAWYECTFTLDTPSQDSAAFALQLQSETGPWSTPSSTGEQWQTLHLVLTWDNQPQNSA